MDDNGVDKAAIFEEARRSQFRSIPEVESQAKKSGMDVRPRTFLTDGRIIEGGLPVEMVGRRDGTIPKKQLLRPSRGGSKMGRLHGPEKRRHHHRDVVSDGGQPLWERSTTTHLSFPTTKKVFFWSVV